MSMNMNCFDDQSLVRDGKAVRSLQETVLRTGKQVPGYSGMYFNKFYTNLQVVAAGTPGADGGRPEILSSHIHCQSVTVWTCRVVKEITPEGSSGMDMRLLVEPVSSEGNYLTVLDVVNADVLPSYAPGEIIQVQVIAKALAVRTYYNETDYCLSEGQKVDIPFSVDGGRKQNVWVPRSGDPVPAGYNSSYVFRFRKMLWGQYDAEDDALVAVRGEILRRVYFRLDLTPDGGEDETVRIHTAVIGTGFGELTILFGRRQLPNSDMRRAKQGMIISADCTIQGDAMIYDYENGFVNDRANNLAAVRYAFSSGRIKRLLPVLSDGCRLCVDGEEQAAGKEAVTDYLAEQYRCLKGTEWETLYGLVSDPGDGAECDAAIPAGTACIVLREKKGAKESPVQHVFPEFDGEERISAFRVSCGGRCRCTEYRSMAEMKEDPAYR